MKRIFHWLDENLEEFLLVIGLIAMTLIMGIQVFCRYVLGMSLSWSEELTRYIFILILTFFPNRIILNFVNETGSLFDRLRGSSELRPIYLIWIMPT